MQRKLTEIYYNNNNNINCYLLTNEDEKSANKDMFWEKLSETTEEGKGRLIILGDLNGRVGRKDGETGEVIGNYGENARNNNGRRLIEYCILHNLIITNTFFEHKNIHKYTREQINRNERSIIDYVIVNKEFRREVKDTKVRRSFEIYSDHYLVLSEIEISNKEKIENNKTNKRIGIMKTIRTHKLREEETAKLYKEISEREMNKIKNNINSRYVNRNTLENDQRYISCHSRRNMWI